MQFTEFKENGFLVLHDVLNEKTISVLTEAVSKLQPRNTANRNDQRIYGVRDLLNLSPEIKEFSQSETVKKIVRDFIGENAQVVRAIYFNKTAEANWKVPWHQDLTIAVKEKQETEGFTAWTRKVGIFHVQPPIEILEKMLTLRFHLDDADETNGALKIIPKFHTKGRLNAEKIKQLRKANETAICSVKKGDCLIMRPLLLHSSSAGSNPKNRRVIHFEFSSEDLPNGLNWYDS
jgi:ectoine hydroxylase-related dioxygenase (phytanoyl-CoA dioxygenase family)